MYTLKLNWKEYNINLNLIETHMRASYPSYIGSEGREYLGLCFESEPSQEDLENIVAYWESLNEESEAAISYKSLDQIKNERDILNADIVQIKLGMLEKTWATMNGVERKLYLGLDSEVTQAEIDALE